MRTLLIYCGILAVLVGSVSGPAWAGRSGRRNTAIIATAGAAIAWGRYQDARRCENRRPVKRVVVTEHRPAVQREVVYVYRDDCKGKKRKHHKHHQCGECEHPRHHKHHCDDDD